MELVEVVQMMHLGVAKLMELMVRCIHQPPFFACIGYIGSLP